EGTLARGAVESDDADRVAFLHRIDEQPSVHLLRRPELAIKCRSLELGARHREILELVDPPHRKRAAFLAHEVACRPAIYIDAEPFRIGARRDDEGHGLALGIGDREAYGAGTHGIADFDHCRRP